MSKTVFVIGAGASKEANLPTGEELKGNISSLLDIRFDYQQVSGDYLITDAIKLYVHNLDKQSIDSNSFFNASRSISSALPLAISIDNYIDAHRDDDKVALCGKLAIVRSILAAEKQSLLFFNKFNNSPKIDLEPLENSWYLPFFQLLTESCKIDELGVRFQSIALIVFNYDRCIEHFLINALKIYYGVTDIQAAELVKKIDIYHPYGSVGTLPLLGTINSTEFGAEPDAQKLLNLANEIKTFTEGTDPDSSEIVAIHEHMKKTKKIIFIGFSFHKLNMKLISPKFEDTSKHIGSIALHVQKKFGGIHCYATTYGISESDQKVVNMQINGLFNNAVSYSAGVRQERITKNMSNKTCKDFFSEYWRSLSF